MSLTRIEMDALADIVEERIRNRKQAAQALGASENTKFLEAILEKLGRKQPAGGWQWGGCRRPDLE